MTDDDTKTNFTDHGDIGNNNGSPRSGRASLLSAIRSPLSLFALAVLVCDAVFALAAAKLGSLTAFVYSMHLFLGIIGTFTIIALWSPRTLYHPKDLQEIKIPFPKKQLKINAAITGLILILLIFYVGASTINRVRKISLSIK